MEISTAEMIDRIINTEWLDKEAADLRTNLEKKAGIDGATPDQRSRDFSASARAKVRDILVESYQSDAKGLRTVYEFHETGLSKRVEAVLKDNFEKNRGAWQSLALRGMVLPACCFRLAPALRIPNRPIDQQTSRQLARTITVAQIYTVDSALDIAIKRSQKELSPKVMRVMYKILPAVQRRFLKAIEKELKTHWTYDELLKTARYVTSDAGRRYVDVSLRILALVEQEKQAVLTQATHPAAAAQPN